MKLSLDLSQYSTAIIVQIAKETRDKDVLAELSQSTDDDVVVAVINNPETDDKIRDSIYWKWKNDEGIVRELLEWPMSTSAIHDVVVNRCVKDSDFCDVVHQEGISVEDLKAIFSIVTADDWDSHNDRYDFIDLIVSNPNTDQELLQKIVKYSPITATYVAKRYNDCLRVDLSLRENN